MPHPRPKRRRRSGLCARSTSWRRRRERSAAYNPQLCKVRSAVSGHGRVRRRLGLRSCPSGRELCVALSELLPRRWRRDDERRRRCAACRSVHSHSRPSVATRSSAWIGRPAEGRYLSGLRQRCSARTGQAATARATTASHHRWMSVSGPTGTADGGPRNRGADAICVICAVIRGHYAIWRNGSLSRYGVR